MAKSVLILARLEPIHLANVQHVTTPTTIGVLNLETEGSACILWW